jgi:hypothetical protein
VRLDFLVPIFGILLVMIPVLGITTIVTLRWGLMPFMERLARELEESGFVAPKVLERRVEELTRELEAVTTEVERLQKAQEFDRRLLESPPGHPSPGRPSPEQGTRGPGTDEAARPDPPAGGERPGRPGRRGSEGLRALSPR